MTSVFKRFTLALALAFTALIALPSIAFAAPVDINAQNFPDANFRAYIQDLAGGAPTIDDASVVDIDVSSRSISSLEGVELFPHLTSLICESNDLTSLNVSSNTALQELNCLDNKLSALDVSNNPLLLELTCSNNNLAELDVSQNVDLTILDCYANQISSLDLSNNVALEAVMCDENQLTKLDVSNSPDLTTLFCGANNLTELDVSSNTLLTDLYCDTAHLYDINRGSVTPSSFLSIDQTLIVPVISVAPGEYVSTQAYPLFSGHTIAVTNASYESNLFKTSDYTQTAPFVTNLGGGYEVSGTITFTLSHTVEFKDWDGTVLDTQIVEDGASAVAPADPVRAGYVFTGWDIAFTNVTENLTVTAQYEPLLISSVWVDGNNYLKGSNKPLVLSCSATYDDATRVIIGGIEVPRDSVSLSAGSTIATLSPAFLEELSVGTHTIRLEFPGGFYSENSFEISAAPSPTPTPDNDPSSPTPSGEKKLTKTSDITPIAPLFIFAGLMGAVLFMAKRKSLR